MTLVDQVSSNKKSKWTLMISLVIFVIALLTFVLIAHEVVLEKEDWFDTRIFALIKPHLSKNLIEIFSSLTFFGSGNFLLPAWVLLCCTLIYFRRKKVALEMVVLAITSSGLVHMFKVIFKRHRPDMPVINMLETYSFPSGHALSSLVFFSALIWLCWHSNTQPTNKWLIAIIKRIQDI